MHSRSIILALAVVAFGSSAFAQNLSKYEVSGGWQMLHSDNDSIHGWYGDLAVNLNRVLTLVGSVDGLDETTEDAVQTGQIIASISAETSIYTFLGGARLNLRVVPRIVPYVEFLAGAHRLSGTATITVTGMPTFTTEALSQGDPVVQIAGGVTLQISRPFGVRVSVAHRRVFLEDDTGSVTRIAAGAVLSF